MGVFELRPHSCQFCKRIEIDGTSGTDGCVAQAFTWTLPEVQTFAEECMLFKWSLQPTDRPLRATDYVDLRITTTHEDLESFEVRWKDVNGIPVPLIDRERSRLHIFAERNDSTAQYIKSRPLRRSRAGSMNMNTYRKHLENCHGTHEKCKEAMKAVQHNVAPRRLLYTRPNLNPRLYKAPEGESPRYVALSYCWGDAKQMEKAMTTKANVQDRHRMIELSQLPQTIKDAIKVTRSLGLEYLWVDAICIIQDDPEDSAAELEKMSSVYLGSTLTISAASAKDSMEGFLGDRDLKRAYGSVFQLPYCHRSNDDVVTGKMLLAEHPICDMHQEPIDERAWTMQEHMLPLRLIRFGSKQTIWRCLTHYVNIDGGGSSYLMHNRSRFTVGEPHRMTEVQSWVKRFGNMSSSIILGRWSDSIMEYTNRKLSHPGDKLPACAALAETFSKTMGWEATDYLAGLWENDIQVQLLWYRRKGIEAERLPGPTWSWATLNGPVTFCERRLLEYYDIAKAQARLENKMIIHKFVGHKYSEVESGRLWLNGCLQQAHWDGSHLRRSAHSPQALPFTIHWDSTSTIGPRPVWCFEIIASYISFGLMLGTKNETDFERIGYFECDNLLRPQSLFGEVKPRTIILH